MEDLFKPTQPSTPDESQITPDSLDSEGSTSLANIFDGLDTDSLLFQAGYYLLVFLLAALLGFLFFLLLKFIFYRLKIINDWKESAFLEIRVPQESAEDENKENNTSNKDEKEVLSIGEQIFLVMSEYSKPSLINWLMGCNRFSLEIVSVNQEITFILVCSKKLVSIVENQVIAIYPKANITRHQTFNFFKPNTVAYAQEMTFAKRYELPFRTYRQMEKDPLNALTNTLSSLNKEESAAIQLVITPINEDWQKKPRILANKIQQGQNPEEILVFKFNLFVSILKFIGAVIKAFKQKNDQNSQYEERNIDLTGRKQAIQLTPQHQEIIKKLEEKSSRPGFLFDLRIIASSKSEQRSKQIVSQIIPSFQIFEINPFNSFKRKKTKPKQSVLNFLLRTSSFWRFKVMNTEEINSIWHLPNSLVKNSYIKWLLARKPSIPLNIPGPGKGNVYIGMGTSGNQKKDVYLQTEDRFRHIYALGSSGSGKSVFLTNLILQDIKIGNGVCVVDPHGETVDDVLLRIPKERAKDVIVFSPAITDRPLGLNMLEIDPKKPTQKTLVIDTLFQIWDKLYDLQKTGGPMFESYMKNSMRLVMAHPESGSTLMEISKVLVDEDYRSFKLAMCEEEEVVDFWEKQAQKAGGEAALENMVPYITSKLAPFVNNDFIRPMIGQQKSAINFREAMDNKKIILIKLEKGLIGETSAYLVGMVTIGNILLAGMGRNDGLHYNLDGTTKTISKNERSPFFVYIDEMQNFLFDAIPKALEEIRKYKVGFCLAHQFVKQVVKQGDERIKDSIMSNTGSKFIFRCGAEDAELLQKEFAPHLTAKDLQNPERFTANTIILSDGQKTTPFNIYPPNLDSNTDTAFRDQLLQINKQKYGKTKEEVEKEIKSRSKFLF